MDDDLEKRMDAFEKKLKDEFKKMDAMSMKIDELTMKAKLHRALITATHTTTLEFFLRYAYLAVGDGKYNVQKAEGHLPIHHSFQEDLPRTLDGRKHSAALEFLEKMKEEGDLDDDNGCCTTIAGIAAALVIQKGIHDLLSPEELEMMRNLFTDLFGISVDEASVSGRSPLYCRKLDMPRKVNKRLAEHDAYGVGGSGETSIKEL